MKYNPFHYEDILENGRDKKLKLGPKGYEWRSAGSKPSPEREAGLMLPQSSNNINLDDVERTQTTRFSPPGEGDLSLESEKTTHHNPPDSFSESVEVVDQIDTLLNEDAYKRLHHREGADVQSGEDTQDLYMEETAHDRVKGSSPRTSELHREDFQPVRLIDKEGKLNPAQRNEAQIQNEHNGKPKPTPDVTAVGDERAKDSGMAASQNLGVSAPEREVHFLESPVSTARPNINYQDALLVGKNKSCTDTEVSSDVSNRLSTATGFESIHENPRNSSPEAKDVESGSGTGEDVTAASSLRSHSQDLHKDLPNENPDRLDLIPENMATILISNSQQSEMSPILSSSSPEGVASSSIVVEDLKSDGSSSFADKDLQYYRTSRIAFQYIRKEGQLDSTVFSSPSQQRLEGAFSSMGNRSSTPNSEDRPWREEIVSIEERNTELIGIATEAKPSPLTEAIQVEEPPTEKNTDESLMLSEQCDKEQLEIATVTKPEVESSMEHKVDSSPASPSAVRNRISDKIPAPWWPSGAELQRDLGQNNCQTHSLQTKEDYHKEYRSNSINTDVNLTSNNDDEKSNSKAMTAEPTQMSIDESPQKGTIFEDEISSRHELNSAKRDNEAELVKLPTKPEIEIIDLESECGNEKEYHGVSNSQLASTEIENTGDAPFDDDQGAKDGDSESTSEHIPHPVTNRKEGADEAIGDDVMAHTVNNNQKVDHHTGHQFEQSSIALSNPARSGQNSAVEQSFSKDDPSLHGSDSVLAGSPLSPISSLDQNTSKNSANTIYETQLFTPAASQQQKGFIPEPSAAMVQPPDNELPAPSMTETSTAPLVRPNIPKEKPTPSAKQSSLISEESISSMVEGHSFGDLDSPLTKMSTAPPLKPSTPDGKHLVVEKLRAIRTRSTKRALARKTTDRSSSASPWFTPKESGQFKHVSDSEGELESIYSSDQESPIQEGSLPPRPSPPAPTQNHSISEPSPSGLRTALSYYAPLSTLLSNFNNPTSVLATVHSFNAITQSISGPRDYHQSLYLTDPSSVSCPLTLARIFRPNELAFPNLIQGDAILLRNFKVQSFQNRVGLLSTNSSAWAVFRQDTEVQVRGPPVEFGPEERSFARALWNWWASVRTEHGKREILQMPIVFIEKKEGETHEALKDERESKPHILPTGVASKQNATKTHARKPDVSPSPKPPAKDGETAQGTPTKIRTRSISTQGTSSSPVSDPHTLRDGTSYESGPHEPSPDREVPAHRGGHTPTRTPPKRRRNITSIQASKLSPGSDRHVLRDGTSYESTPEKMMRRPGVNYHELRDGTTYVDDDGCGDMM